MPQKLCTRTAYHIPCERGLQSSSLRVVLVLLTWTNERRSWESVDSVEEVGLLNSLDCVYMWGVVALCRPGLIEFMILPQSPKGWDARHVPSYLAEF